MKAKIIFITILSFIQLSNLPAQTNISDLKPSAYFDFWIGSWDLRWEKSDGTIGEGENTITKILSNKVIQEDFKVTNDPAMSNFTGKSWSVYNKNNGTWYQTWVDNNGAYLDFIGEFHDNKRIFKREFITSDGSLIMQRMVFYEITKNSFSWDWETSLDRGKTWNLRWRIHYTRQNESE